MKVLCCTLLCDYTRRIHKAKKARQEGNNRTKNQKEIIEKSNIDRENRKAVSKRVFLVVTIISAAATPPPPAKSQTFYSPHKLVVRRTTKTTTLTTNFQQTNCPPSPCHPRLTKVTRKGWSVGVGMSEFLTLV